MAWGEPFSPIPVEAKDHDKVHPASSSNHPLTNERGRRGVRIAKFSGNAQALV